MAMEFLRGQGSYNDAPRPDLIVLDLNLPRKDGLEVLAEVKEDDDLKTIPVVVLTTSSAEADILRSYHLHANSYVTKPVGFQPFLDAVRGSRTSGCLSCGCRRSTAICTDSLWVGAGLSGGWRRGAGTARPPTRQGRCGRCGTGCPGP